MAQEHLRVLDTCTSEYGNQSEGEMCVEPHCLSGGNTTVPGGWASIACSPGDLYQLWTGSS